MALQNGVLLALVLSVLLAATGFVPEKEPLAVCRAFLSNEGWETAAEVTEETVLLPETPDAAWETYLAIQRADGFPMEHFAGRSVRKFSFCILNHPSGETVWAHVFWADGIIGGDILSPRIDGFMHGLYISKM